MNMAILGKLYEIADGVWERMTKNTTGSFTASEVYKNRYGDFWLDLDLVRAQCALAFASTG